MQSAIAQTHTCSFNLKTIETHNRKQTVSEFVVKVNSTPYKVFLFCVSPNPGVKALLAKGFNDDKVIVHPNSFPFFNLSLSPYNSLLRKNHHFTMWEMGFNYTKELFESYIKKDSLMFMNSIHVLPDEEFDRKICHRIEIIPPLFYFSDYVVKQGEDITSISKRLLLNDNMILEHNPQLSSMNDVKKGSVIRVPNVLAKRIVLYLDRNTFLPIVQEMYDDRGLFIRVEMSSLVRNPKFDVNEFSKEKF
ncbi:MAG TPA: DUF1571 domain-containing protein [Bacteroidia bacterium]|nr:DUF1571 domain-containing protein [Bacteroidia bacterium]HNU32648.1 DUF1571 domain-containing protein [Bacteroidia bacterium]